MGARAGWSGIYAVELAAFQFASRAGVNPELRQIGGRFAGLCRFVACSSVIWCILGKFRGLIKLGFQPCMFLPQLRHPYSGGGARLELLHCPTAPVGSMSSGQTYR